MTAANTGLVPGPGAVRLAGCLWLALVWTALPVQAGSLDGAGGLPDLSGLDPQGQGLALFQEKDRRESGYEDLKVDLEMVLHSALRMRADRLIMGDVRGAEALELVSVLSSSCDGSLVCVTGDGPEAALARLTAMARLGAPGASSVAMSDLIACSLDVVVHVARYADGVVRVASVA